MRYGHARRTAALAVTTAVLVGGGLLVAAPAGAVSKTGGIGCRTNGVTLFEGTSNGSVACFAGSAGSVDTGIPGTGSVMGVWNHGPAPGRRRSGVPQVGVPERAGRQLRARSQSR